MRWEWVEVVLWLLACLQGVCMRFNTLIYSVTQVSSFSLDNLIFAGGIRKISRAFMDFHCRNIQSIDFSRCHMANPGLKFFCESLNGSPLINLRYLRIYWNSINAGGIRHLALTISLGILDSLELLDISSELHAEMMR